MMKVISDIPGSGDWKIIRNIKEGWSEDTKYFVEDNRGRRLLLRISDGRKYEVESPLYEALGELSKWDIGTAKLLCSGLCNDGNHTFRVFSWVEGVEIRKVLASFSEKEQFDHGYNSGLILRRIHKIKSPPHRVGWDIYYNQKIERKIQLYTNCGISFPHSDRVIKYIRNQQDLLGDRPQSLLHGDFHIGNMLLTPDNDVAVIDFNRLDFGDPWEEFNRIIWTATESVSFARGQINGYFGGNIPTDFFKLMALYIGVNLIGSIPWAIPYGDVELQTILKLTNEVMESYDNFDRTIPHWYSI